MQRGAQLMSADGDPYDPLKRIRDYAVQLHLLVFVGEWYLMGTFFSFCVCFSFINQVESTKYVLASLANVHSSQVTYLPWKQMACTIEVRVIPFVLDLVQLISL